MTRRIVVLALALGVAAGWFVVSTIGWPPPDAPDIGMSGPAPPLRFVPGALMPEVGTITAPDPVAFEQELRETLAQLELRQAMTEKLRIALSALVSKRLGETQRLDVPILRRVAVAAVEADLQGAVGHASVAAEQIDDACEEVVKLHRAP